MKEIEIETIVDDCTAQLYFDAIYATDATIRAFHSKINHDPDAKVEPWRPDGGREVKFVMLMKLPAMLKKFIGMDSVPVVEKQRLEWEPDRSSFKLVSEPLLNFPGANKFTTSGFLTVTSRPDGSCLVKIIMRCAAAMPWPVQATVEGLMGTEAVASIGVFLDFCKEFYAMWRSEQVLQPARPAAPPGAEVGDQFFDAVDDESDLQRSGAAAGEEDETSVVPYQPPRLEDIIVDCLRQIQSSTSETARSLRNLEELFRNMDDNMQVIRDKLVGKRPQASTSGPSGAAASGGSTGGRPGGANQPAAAAAVPRGSSTSYLGFLAATSLVCGAGAFVYVRYRQAAVGGGGGGGCK